MIPWISSRLPCQRPCLPLLHPTGGDLLTNRLKSRRLKVLAILSAAHPADAVMLRAAERAREQSMM